MKIKGIYLLLMAFFFLAACSEDTENSVSAAESAKEAPAYYEGYVKNPQVTDDRKLHEEGQSIRDGRGELMLNRVNMKNETHKIGDIELTVQEAKLFHYTPDHSMVDFFHSYTHETDFDMVKLFVEVKNTSDEPLHFAPIALLQTSEEELKLWEDDVYLEELNGEIKAGESKKGNLGFIVENPEIDSFIITTSDVFNGNNEKLEDAQKVEVKF